AGLVESHGKTKGRTWHLSAAAYRALGEKAAYVRRRDFEPLQQEQMVLQYVDTHGRITRSEAAELCRLTGPQAYRLLARLAGRKLLVPDKRRGRGAGYRRGPE
ncbi:MAG: AAA family ATPase, partial [Actinobacteria bacterium]|nr:AAA family ATPase [Actinomycetota bacterium]